MASRSTMQTAYHDRRATEPLLAEPQRSRRPAPSPSTFHAFAIRALPGPPPRPCAPQDSMWQMMGRHQCIRAARNSERASLRLRSWQGRSGCHPGVAKNLAKVREERGAWLKRPTAVSCSSGLRVDNRKWVPTSAQGGRCRNRLAGRCVLSLLVSRRSHSSLTPNQRSNVNRIGQSF